MYSDIQKMLKRMRKAGMIVRYIIAGEYGAELGRAHWHGIFHFYGSVLPEWEGEHLNWSQEEWDRVGGIRVQEWARFDKRGKFEDYLGHVHIKKATYAHVRYALKYLLKQQYDDSHQVLYHMSRKPPLGYRYFAELAVETAEAGLAIVDLKYKFDITTRSGERKTENFLLRGRLAEIYLEYYLTAWKHYHGTTPVPVSDVMEIWREYGRLTNEDMATQKRVAEIPGPKSTINQWGESHVEAQLERGKRDSYAGWLKWKDHQYRNEMRAKRAEQRKADGKERRKRNAEFAERSEQFAVAAACQVAGITQEQYAALAGPWRRYVRHRPKDCKSLWDRNAADGGHDAAGARGQYGRPPVLWGQQGYGAGPGPAGGQSGCGHRKR